MHPLPPAVVAALLLILPGASQPPADPLAGAVDIPLSEWTAMATGRTLTYRIKGEFWAMEHYYPNSNHVTLQLYDGSCMQGTWDYSDPVYCFHWDGEGSACFRHARLDGEILIIEQHNNADTPMTQTMSAVTDATLSCAPIAGS